MDPTVDRAKIHLTMNVDAQGNPSGGGGGGGGDASGAKQDIGNASLASIDTKLTSQATASNQTTANASLSSLDTKITATNTKLDSLITALAAANASLDDIETAAEATDTINVAQDSSVLKIGAVNYPVKFAVISGSSSGDNVVVAAVTSKKIRVISYNFMAAGTVNAKFQSDATDITGLKYLVANTGIVAPWNPNGWFETVAGQKLDLNLSAAVAVGGELTYIEV